MQSDASTNTYGCRRTEIELLSFSGGRLSSLEQFATTTSQSLRVFRSRLKTYLFRRSFPRLFGCAHEVTLVIMDTLIVLTYLLTHTRLHSSQYQWPALLLTSILTLPPSPEQCKVL